MTQKSKPTDNNRITVLGGIAAAAVVAIIVIVISSQSAALTASNVDYSQIPSARQEDGGFVLGDPDAPITIVAFEDFLCPHCQAYKPTINQLISEFVATGQARFEYRILPAVDPTYSVVAAQLAECADNLREGAFWEAHDVLFELASARRFNNSTPRDFAERMNMSYTELLDCTATVTQYEIDRTLANQIGVTGTPTVMVRVGNGGLQTTSAGQQPNIDQLRVIIQSAQLTG